MIKKILFIIAGLIVLLVLIGFLLPAKLEISKSYTINAPASAVFEEINDLQRWETWQYWNTLDPEMKITYGEKKVGTGASYSWEGPNLGTGTLGITESIPDKSIAIDMDFGGNPAKGFYSLEPSGENTQLNLSFTSDAGMNPIGHWINIFMKGEIEKSFDYAGDKIKGIAEAKPKFKYTITEENVPPISYVGLSHTMSPKDGAAVSAQMGKMYTELDAVLRKAKVTVTGSPFCLYPKYSEESMDMVCAMPVAADAKVPGKYKIMQTEGGLAVKGVMKGSYDNLQAIHNEIAQYIKYKKLTEIGAPWEVYVTDPMAEKDTTQWITEVYYPVKKN
jgi:effector-binding domain-containing protein